MGVAAADGDHATDARTLFVRNVAFDVDAAQLEEVFADVGPVRQCFLVTAKPGQPGGGGGPQQQQQAQSQSQQRRHKGIAFVQYALPEDAERALEELNGREVAGRRLKVRSGALWVLAAARQKRRAGSVVRRALPAHEHVPHTPMLLLTHTD
jgi:nucleolar protein 4